MFRSAPATVGELRARARARLPRLVFDYIDGAAGDERGAAANIAAFRARRLVPRILTGTNRADTSTTLFGKRYAMPFGIAPMGLCNLSWPGTDEALARAAAAAGIPYGLSTVATTPVETIAAAAPGHAWFQLYYNGDQAIAADLLRRAAAAGIDVLVFTVDANLPARRLRDRRNGFGLRPRWTAPIVLDILRHPVWLATMLRNGRPRLAGFDPYVQGGLHSNESLVAALAALRLEWSALEWLRAQWRGRLVVKGVMHPEDARRCVDLGADGIVVSNHGGRQLESTVASLDMLAELREAAGPGCAVLLDSGVRSGEDVAKAIAAGADFVLVGRAAVYATSALGPARGAARIVELLRFELENAMIQAGCAHVADLRAGILRRAPH